LPSRPATSLESLRILGAIDARRQTKTAASINSAASAEQAPRVAISMRDDRAQRTQMPSPRPWHSRHSHSASAGDAQLRTWSDGLACGVHTADIGRALRAMRSISADTVWINRYAPATS
jgi:hypothetical protein